MRFKEPKDTANVKWTQHVKEKMLFYGLSETKIRRVLRKPDRIEEGVALRTTAVMQKSGSKKNPSEIWVMYQRKIKNQKSPARNRYAQSVAGGKIKIEDILANKEKVIIISAWRYPGISPQGPPPIPEDIIQEIGEIL